jgi:hypothetical protein
LPPQITRLPLAASFATGDGFFSNLLAATVEKTHVAVKEVKRERIRICPTACISRLSRVSRFERSEGMRLAS